MRFVDFAVVYQSEIILGLGALAVLALRPLHAMLQSLVPDIYANLLANTIAHLGFKQAAVLIGVLTVGAAAAKPLPQGSFLDLPDYVCPYRPQARFAVIFVHGWNGDTGETWKNFPKLVCGDARMDSFNVVSFDYPTYIKRRPKWGITKIADHIDAVGRRLGLFSPRYEKVVIIAHSMGGIVSRKLVLLQRADAEPPARTPTLLVAIASPHNGASLGNLAAALQIVDFEHADEVKVGSPYLTDLEVFWEKSGRPTLTRCFGSPDDIVVKLDSANHTCAKTLPGYPAGSHTELVKPTSRCDIRYDFPIKEVLEHVGLPAPVPEECIGRFAGVS